jgi:hypothetical protein
MIWRSCARARRTETGRVILYFRESESRALTIFLVAMPALGLLRNGADQLDDIADAICPVRQLPGILRDRAGALDHAVRLRRLLADLTDRGAELLGRACTATIISSMRLRPRSSISLSELLVESRCAHTSRR